VDLSPDVNAVVFHITAARKRRRRGATRHQGPGSLPQPDQSRAGAVRGQGGRENPLAAPTQAAAGASGAIFGLFGLGFVVWRRRHLVLNPMARAILSQVGTLLVLVVLALLDRVETLARRRLDIGPDGYDIAERRSSTRPSDSEGETEDMP